MCVRLDVGNKEEVEGEKRGGEERHVPSVSASATRKRLKGGRRRRALSIAKVIARMM